MRRKNEISVLEFKRDPNRRLSQLMSRFARNLCIYRAINDFKFLKI